jgi:hypothetical protein
MAKWALIVAVQDYPNIFKGLDSKLPETYKSAKGFRDWITSVKSVPAANLVVCAGSDLSWRTTGTTRAEILGAFTDIVTRSRENADELYVFFAGHGIGFSEDPNEPAIDILIGSDFTNPAASGGACLIFTEIKERLRVALGPGKHFYFVDACRNPMKVGEIKPATIDVIWGRSTRANATTYVLFSTAPGDVAKISSGFGDALLKGLKGTGRAKTWVGGKMYVTFDSLCTFVQRELQKNDLDPEKKGPADGNIVEVLPVPTIQCDVRVAGATTSDKFVLRIVDVRQGQRNPVNFQGATQVVAVSPEDYLLDLTASSGAPVSQVDPPASPDGVDLYQNGKVEFQILPPGTPPPVPFPIPPPQSSIRIFGIPTTEVFLHDLATTALPIKIPITKDEIETTLKPGSYRAHVRDGNLDLDTQDFKLAPNTSITLDFRPSISAGAHQSLSQTIPTRGPLVNFSETLSDVPDWNLSLWLALLGASRILADPHTFSKLKDIPLETFEQAQPKKSVLYILSGEQDINESPRWAIGTTEWRSMQSVPGVPGLFQQQFQFEPGPLLVSYGRTNDTTTVQAYGLPNRATLLTFAIHERGGRQIQQFILPIHSLFDQISGRELDYLTKITQPLPRIRFMSTAQRLFASQTPIQGQTYKESDHYWFDLLHHKWLDPVMALIACYELVRRGAAKDQITTMREVLSNMRTYFAGIPDTEIIAQLLGEPSNPSKNPPLLLDGLMALTMRDFLPLSAANLDFTGIWTSWRNALPLPAVVVAERARARVGAVGVPKFLSHSSRSSQNTFGVQETTFTLDYMGRFLCNTLQEALDSSAVQVAGKQRSFDTIVIGGGTFGAAIASSLLFADATHSRRILILEAGPFVLPEHNQNMLYQGATPDFRKPWDSHPALGYPGLLFAIGGRSLAWGGWSPQMLAAELSAWPASVATDLNNKYFEISSDQIGATDSNDFIFGRLHSALRLQLFQAMKNPANIPTAIPLAAMPNHPAVRYYSGSGTLVAAAAGITVTATPPVPANPPDVQLRTWLGLDPSDTTPGADLLNLLKLEAPLAVQARTAPGEFPNNKYSAVPTLTKAARIAAGETGGIGAEADARKRLMVVPKCHVLDIITETQIDNWVRVTGVRVKDSTGAEQVISLAQPSADGHQGSVIVALGTIESTRLALSTFKDSLSWRAAQRMGTNLVAHLRSNLTIRIPITALSFLAPSDRKNLEVSALFVKGKTTINGIDRFSHLQITASGLGKLGDNSEAELFQKIPDIEHLEGLLNATDTHVVITFRGIGEMTTHNPDSFIRLSPSVTDFNRPAAEVTLADVRDGTSTTPQSEIDKKNWDAMDALADQVAVVFANKQPFEILANDGTIINMPANTTAAQLKSAYPYAGRRDPLGTTHHDAGTLFMGTDPSTSVTNEFGRIHDTTNCYVASPAIFPALGSPNPMLPGIALAYRTSDMLTANVLPRPAVRVIDPGFTPLFDGTASTFGSWKSADAKNGQGFAHIDGEILTYGSTDFALLYFATRAFKDFHLRLQFKCFDSNNNNSGIFVRFLDPRLRLPAALASRADADKVAGNPAWRAVISGFEVQIDDNARGDVNKDFYGRKPEPDGLWKNRTGAIYKIPAGDFIDHLGQYDARQQQYTPGPPLVPGVWFQYDVVVTGNHYEVTLTNTQSGASQVTTVFDNPDTARGIAQLNSQPAGLIGIQSYPNSPFAFRDIWIK